MCRFLLVKSKQLFKPELILKDFALMCRNSPAPNGDWQGDGWGIAWQVQNSKIKVKSYWQTYKSLKPIWKEQERFNQFPKTNILIVHARSAFNDGQKNIIEFNQPYIKNNFCFVFNGTLRGVKLKKPIFGKIGSQKIFNLLLKFLKNNKPDKALRKLSNLLLKNSKTVEGLNIGLSVGQKIYALCQYQSSDDNYFSLRYNKNNNFSIISSGEMGNYKFKKMKKGEILVL